jgi:hypothetical protein
LSDTAVTDVGLDQLKSLQELFFIVMFDTGVSRAKVEELKGLLLGREILYGPRPR